MLLFSKVLLIFSTILKSRWKREADCAYYLIRKLSKKFYFRKSLYEKTKISIFFFHILNNTILDIFQSDRTIKSEYDIL